MRHRVEYLFIRLFVFLIRLLPLRVGVGFGGCLGSLYYQIDARHRRLALDHLSIAFGHTKEPAAIEQIARESYQNLGRSIIEAIYLPQLNLSETERLVRVEGLSHYIEAKNRKKGVMVLTEHPGNWEIIPKGFWMYGFHVYDIVRPFNNPYLDRMIDGWRTQNGMTSLNKRTDVSRILGLLRAGETVGFFLDQNTARENAVFVDFFGREAATHKGPAILAHRSGATVLPVFIVREPSGHRMIIAPPLPIVRDGNHAENIERTTALFTKTIESYITQYPAQWLWTHRRWGTTR